MRISLGSSITKSASGGQGDVLGVDDVLLQRPLPVKIICHRPRQLPGVLLEALRGCLADCAQQRCKMLPLHTIPSLGAGR